MPEITAHRAGAARGPENSLQALAQSIAYGTPWAEIDVQLTADDVVVVHHDEDLTGFAADPRRVRDLHVGDLPVSPGGVRIATLAEFIASARGRIGLNIELKDYGHGDTLVTQVVTLLKEQGFLGQAAVCSFNPALVALAKVRAPELRVGHVIAETGLPPAPADFVSVDHRAVSAALVREAHERDMAVHSWTVNSRDEMLRLLVLGVDNLITDDPALGLATLRHFEGLSGWRRALLRWGA
ncbi:MAG: glycerophosphodiester phosphodiesterase family protein [Hydrogenophaga sp.]